MARIILVALFVLAVSAQRAPSQSCVPANPFLSHMRQLGMLIYDSPKLGVQMCGSEFAQFGTCCDETRIKEYVQKDKAAIEQATEKIVQEFENFMGTTSHILHLAKVVLNLKKKILKKFSDLRSKQIGRKLQVGQTPGANQAHAGLVDQIDSATPKRSAVSTKKGWAAGSQGKSPENESCSRIASKELKGTDPLEIIQPLRTQIQNLENMNKHMAFGVGTRECWNQIASLRSSSVCSTCSGRSHIFFRKDKALMSEEVCVAILDKCYKPLRQLTYFVSVLNLIPKLLGIESQISITTPEGQRELVEMENLSHHLMEKELESTASLFRKADFAMLTAQIGKLRRLLHTEGSEPALLQKAERELCKRFGAKSRPYNCASLAAVCSEQEHRKPNSRLTTANAKLNHRLAQVLENTRFKGSLESAQGDEEGKEIDRS